MQEYLIAVKCSLRTTITSQSETYESNWK